MKYANTYARTTDHSASDVAKVCNTKSIINVMAAVYVFNVDRKPKNYELGMRHELGMAFSIRVAQYPYLTQMESNIIADYFTAPTVEVKKAKPRYEVTIILYTTDNNGAPVSVRTPVVAFPQKSQALKYAKEKIKEVGADITASAHIVKESPFGWSEYEAAYNLEAGLTVY